MSRSPRLRSRLFGRIARTTWRGWFGVALILVVVGALTWWAVDAATLHGRVLRNVTVAGVDVGRRDAASMDRALARAAGAYSHTRIELVNGSHVTTLQAADVGLRLDPAATLAAAEDVGRHDNPVARPFLWLASFVRPRTAPVRVRVDIDRLAHALAALPGQVPVREPAVAGSPYSVGISPGRPGRGYAPTDVARSLQQAATLGKLPIRVTVVSRVIQPVHTDDEARFLAAAAARLTAASIGLVTPDHAETAGPALLRTWITSVATSKGLRLAMKDREVQLAAEQLLGRVQHPPAPAAWTVVNDNVRLVPQINGTRCCAAASGKVLLAALMAHQPSVRLPLISTPPAFTTAKAKALGITTRIGAKTSFGGFTDDREFTIAFGGGVAPNVSTGAAVLRGRVLRPHQSLSLNQLFGPPSPRSGFVAAPVATADGPTLVSGGGQDVVATALFNAAFYAGLDIVQSTRHSVQIPTFPPGREADLQWPGPDLVIRNNTPYGVLIWTTMRGGSLTVSLFSTPWATANQTGQSVGRTGPEGRCTRYVTTRTRTYPGGRSDVDTFTAVYAPIPESRTDPIRTRC